MSEKEECSWMLDADGQNSFREITSCVLSLLTSCLLTFNPLKNSFRFTSRVQYHAYKISFCALTSPFQRRQGDIMFQIPSVPFMY